MHAHTRALLNSRVHYMRAPFPAAIAVHRYLYKDWKIDIVTYDATHQEWAAYLSGLNVDGRRFGPFSSVASALAMARLEIDAFTLQCPVVMPVPPKRRPTKRYKKKPRKVRA